MIKIFEKPKLILIILVVVTAIFGMGLSRLEVRNNFDGELPNDDPSIRSMSWSRNILMRELKF
jgi:predicted RND superfamily exporter protein